MPKINDGRIKPKKESTFGKVKKPFKGTAKNRKGNKKESLFKHEPIRAKASKAKKRNPLDLHEFYVYMRDIANSMGCDAHHWMPKSKLKQDIFIALVPYDEHRAIHAEGNSQSPWQWAEAQGIDMLVQKSMDYFEEWAIVKGLSVEYFELVEQLKEYPFSCHDIARDFILNNRGL